jgi:hypothetical protein
MISKSALRTIPVTAALLGAAMFSLPASVIAAASQEVSANFMAENAITAELKELRGLMSQLDTDADQLHSLTNSRLHWQTHASRLTTVKDHVNRIGDQLEVLQTMRLSAAPWQQEAIDSLVPAASQVAGHTTSAIDHLNESSQRLWAPDYIDHLRAIAALSDHMHGLVDNHLKIIDAQSKIQSLEYNLAERVL